MAAESVVCSALVFRSVLLVFSRGSTKAFLLCVDVLANGLAVDTEPNPRTGAAVLRLELVLGFDDCLDFEAAKGDEAPEPKEENGLTKGFETFDAGAGVGLAGE